MSLRDGAPASVHIVEVLTDSARHYHRTLTEIYTCIDGQGTLELDDDGWRSSPE